MKETPVSTNAMMVLQYKVALSKNVRVTEAEVVVSLYTCVRGK